MIRIIRPGTRKKTECDTCGCEFTYEKEDVKEASPDPFRMVRQKEIQKEIVQCPQCGREIVIKQTKGV